MMSHVTLAHRLYLAAVGFLAITVGFWCYFDPTQSANGIPWTLPALCATFLGSLYLSGAVYTVVCIFSRRWGEIQMFMPQCALWTGGLTIVSLFYLSAFDFSRNQTQLWFLAYVVYPIVAAAFLWIHRAEWNAPLVNDTTFPRWVKSYLRVQGTLMLALGLALLLAPHTLQPLWPWRTGGMMLQLYSMPLLAYGVGSWLMSNLTGWAKIRNALIAQAVFFGAEFFASLRFAALFDGPALSVVLWFSLFALLTAALVVGSAVSVCAALPHPARLRPGIPKRSSA
jgi:hypothetical protein